MSLTAPADIENAKASAVRALSNYMLAVSAPKDPKLKSNLLLNKLLSEFNRIGTRYLQVWQQCLEAMEDLNKKELIFKISGALI